MTIDEQKEHIAFFFVHRHAPDGREVWSDDILRMLDSLIAAAEARGFEKGKAEGAEQIKAMNVGIVTCRDGALGMTEGHDLKYPLVQGATYALIRVCETDGPTDGHATMKAILFPAPKESEK